MPKRVQVISNVKFQRASHQRATNKTIKSVLKGNKRCQETNNKPDGRRAHCCVLVDNSTLSLSLSKRESSNLLMGLRKKRRGISGGGESESIKSPRCSVCGSAHIIHLFFSFILLFFSLLPRPKVLICTPSSTRSYSLEFFL